MNILTGNLVMGGLETGYEAVSWVFEVKKVDGIEVRPKPQNHNQPKRTKGGAKKKSDSMPQLMSPEEHKKYFEEWERTKSPRVVGGETVLRTGDYLEVFSDDTYTEKIWIGTVCLVACIPDYSSIYMPDYEIDTAPLDVPDLAYWHNMHYYEMPAILIPNFGLQQN
jgi:hypothetical protein